MDKVGTESVVGGGACALVTPWWRTDVTLMGGWGWGWHQGDDIMLHVVVVGLGSLREEATVVTRVSM